MHHLALSGQLPHLVMCELARRHGPVMLLRLGEVPTLVVSSREGARELMKTHDLAFATRPKLMKTHDLEFATRPLNATLRVLAEGGRDIVFAPYSEYWRQLRIAVSELLSAPRVLSFHAVREEEVASILRGVAQAAPAARPVELRELISLLVTDITARAVMGDRRFKERAVFLSALARSAKLAAGFNPPDLWPSSRLVGCLSRAVRRAKECSDTGNGVFDAIICGRTMGGQKEHNLLDGLLSMQKEGRIDMDTVKYVVLCLHERQEVFSVGNDTTATTLEWAIIELIRNPEVTQKATAEVRQAFQASGTMAEHALGKLPYMHLVIRETLRLHTPVPLLLPRQCQESCQVLGYDVPQGTQVLVNVWALAHDERYWHDAPDEFRPERFEGEAAVVDFRGTDFSFLPFGAGRRMCPGIGFGLANIELALASLLFHFDWEGPPPDEIDMAEEFGLTVRRKADLLLRPILRVPVHIVLSEGNHDR